MSTTDPNTPLYPGFDDLLAELMSRQDVGEAFDRDRLLREHPEFAEELLAFLDDLALIDRLRGPVTRTHPVNDAPSPVSLPTRFGDYVLLEEIARGGMGVVYKARQTKANRLVALKMVRERLVDTPDRMRRFRSEVDAVAVLDHPNIVPLYEVGEYNGQPYFSMKLIEGGSLAAAVAGGQWPVASQEAQRRAAELIATVARAVHYAHQRGILHRDLKPGNILLGSSIDECRSSIENDVGGTPSHRSSIDSRQSTIPYVTDFGLARRLDDDSHLTATGSVVGTPAYMAPEQALGRRDLSVAVDVYALGAILYELLTGRPPFRGDSTVETILQVRDKEPTRPGSLVRGLQRDLEIICLKCLRKEAQERYGSALALAEDLERWLAGEPIAARPVGAPQRAWKWARRKPALAGALALCLLLLLGGIAGVFSQWRRAEQRERDTRDALDEARRQLDRAERHLYYQRIALADREWLGNRGDLSAQLLDACPHELRHWEWHYLSRRGREGVQTLAGHGTQAKCVAFHPHGSLLVTVGSDRRVRVWDLTTGTCRHALGPFPHFINDASFSPDGRLLAVSGTGVGVRLWEVHDGGKELRERPIPIEGAGGGFLAFSDDGHWLAASGPNGQKTIAVWDTETGKLVATKSGSGFATIQSIAFQPGTRRLVGVGWNWLAFWDVPGAGLLQPVLNAGAGVSDLAWHPDGRELALAAGRSVLVVDVKPSGPPQIRQRLEGHGGPVTGVAYRPDGRQLVSVSQDGTARVWDVESQKDPVRTLQGQSGPLSHVAWHPRGTHLALAGGNGNVKVWDLAYTGPGSIVDMAGGMAVDRPVRPAGLQLAVARRSLGLFPRTWATGAAGTDAGKLPAMVHVTYRPDGGQVATTTKESRVDFRDPDTGRSRGELRVGQQRGGVELAYSPDGLRLATAEYPNTEKLMEAYNQRLPAEVRLWRAVGDGWSYAEIGRLTGVTAWCSDLEFSPDGRWVAAAGQDHRIHVWDLTRLGPDGLLPAAWSTAPLDRPFRSVSFAPQGSLLASGGTDGVVRLWDVESGNERGSLSGHTAAVRALAFTSDGRRLVSGGEDGLLRIWDVANRHELLTLQGHDKRINSVAFTPDGHVLLSAGDDGVRAWDGSP